MSQLPEIVIDDAEDSLLPATIDRSPLGAIAVREGLSAEDTVIEDWLDEQRSPHTRRSYRTSINLWRDILAKNNCCDFWWPHRRHAFEWKAALREAGLKPKSVDARLIAARSFYDHMCDRDDFRLPINPIKSKKLLLNLGPHQPTQALAPKEVRALTRAARKAGPDRRLLVLFLVVTGCRISEAINLRVEDLQRQAGQPIAMLTRKGGKRGPAAVDAQVFDLLVHHCQGAAPQDHVFQPHRAGGKRTGGGFTYSGAYSAVQAISAAAELTQSVTGVGVKPKSRVSPHVLRATLITTSIEEGIEITDISDQVGHASSETTKLYNRGGKRVRRMAAVSGVMAGMADLED